MIRDRRSPPYIISSFFRNRLLTELKKDLNTIGNIKFLLTFDVEYDFGVAELKRSNSVQPFLEQIIELLKEEKVCATFFVQGDLIKNFNEILQRLEGEKNELGLHGYAHEPWGYDWFIRDQIPSINSRRTALESSITEFEMNNLKRPISFRAPYMVIDKMSLQLLGDYGFKIDSSAQSYKGIMPFISKINGLLEVPVSVDPIPKMKLMYCIPYSHYFAFNMKNLVDMSNNEFLEYVQRILSIQNLYNQNQHLVFLAHAWEFTEHPRASRKYRYCTDKNFELLFDRINSINDNYDVRYFKMKDLLAVSQETNK